MVTPEAIVDTERLAAVCSRYGIARLMIFGSVARGTAEPSSDVDILSMGYDFALVRHQSVRANRSCVLHAPNFRPTSTSRAASTNP